MQKNIPYGRQNISQKDIEAVVSVLKSDFLTQGPVVPKFEQAIAEYCGAHHAFAVSNATSALHLACLSLGVGPGDRVWTSPNTFVASANCVLYCGATIDFIDIDPKTYNISIKSLQEKLELSEKNNELPKVIIAVHFSGQSCDMEQFKLLSERYGFSIIEDASHAIGGTYQREKIGSCRYSDISIFSFHPVKIITTGEGGMLLTNNSELAEKIQLLRNHGITRKQDEMTQIAHGDWYYEQLALGYNYRMTEMQAALGLSQLSRLDEFVLKRRELAEFYNQELLDLPISLPWQSEKSQSSWHLYVIALELNQLKKSKKIIFSELRKNGIGVNLHYIPVHTQPYYKSLGFKWGDFPNSEKYYQQAMTIPLFPDMSNLNIEKIKEQLTRCFNNG